MRIHNALLGGVVFWGTLAFSTVKVSVGTVVKEIPDDFTDRWEQLSYNQCTSTKFKVGFLCDFTQGPPEPTKPKRLYVSPYRSEFSQKALGLDH